jgi:hypothetical protein
MEASSLLDNSEIQVRDKFAEEAQAKEQSKLVLQNSSNGTNVIGIVTPLGVGGVKGYGDSYWSVTFNLAPWKKPDGDLEPLKLYVNRLVATQDEIDEYRNLIKPYDIVQIEVKFEEANPYFLPAILTSNQIVKISDPTLEDIANELQRPVSIQDELFGELKFDSALSLYQTKANWLGEDIDLSIMCEEGENIYELIPTAKKLWSAQKSWSKKIKDYAVSELLELKNEGWRHDGERKVSAKKFKEHMKLESIIVWPGGLFEFYHNDGDLFAGHWILVSGSLEEGPTDAAIPG